MKELDFLGVAVILTRDGKVLLCQRKAEDRPFFGKWAVAGGGVEDDELHWPALAAMREVEEETGLALPHYSFAYLGHERAEGDCTGGCLYYVVRLGPNDVPQNTEPHKHTNWEWYTFEEALKKDLVPRLSNMLKKIYA